MKPLLQDHAHLPVRVLHHAYESLGLLMVLHSVPYRHVVPVSTRLTRSLGKAKA